MKSYLETIEELAKSDNLRKGEIMDFTRQVLRSSAAALNCQRCNAWLYENEQTKLSSILSYKKLSDSFDVESSLDKIHLPNYFRFLEKNEIIVADNAKLEPINEELIDSYLTPNEITAMIDVPLRSEGIMIGVICFEFVQIEHTWSDEDKRYTQSIAQLMSLALETKKKNEYRNELETIIGQKEVLISEINHRVKNNMAIIISLMNLHINKINNPVYSNLLEEIKGKVHSMSMVQQHLHASDTPDRISLHNYILTLVEDLNNSFSNEIDVKIKFEMEEVVVDISEAIPCGLIVNEILTNSFKYALNDQNKAPKLFISLKKIDDSAVLTFQDNGPGFDLKSPSSGMGIELINDLSEQIEGSVNFIIKNGVLIELIFPLSEV